MGACVAGNNVTWDVVAHASNSCGNDAEQKSASVRCKNVPWTIVAVATNDCDAVGQRKEQTVNVLCKSPPCVDLLDVHANVAAACPGAPVIVSGSVKNCGSDAADYTVTIDGVQVFSGSL